MNFMKNSNDCIPSYNLCSSPGRVTTSRRSLVNCVLAFYNALLVIYPPIRMECIIEQLRFGFCDPNTILNLPIYERGLKIQMTFNRGSLCRLTSPTLQQPPLFTTCYCQVIPGHGLDGTRY